MPRGAASTSLDQIVSEVVQEVVARVSKAIAEVVSKAIEEQLVAALARPSAPAAARRGRATQRSRPARRELSTWVADRRARRVPTFVIEATGLDTKKKIVARYGEDAAFEKGKALPGAKAGAGPSAAASNPPPRVVRARPPVVRKAGGAR